ncbi:MAG: hypothetical protein QOC63_2903 [Mycobacterium sp.]|nr:hypothetical protein [Mycobacterium sp.]
MSGVTDWLSGTASGIAIVTGIAVATRFGIKRWRRRPAQQRLDQAEILDRLALRRPIETIESTLGTPHLITPQYAAGDEWIEERVYRLAGAWVTVQAPKGVVETYSITITDADLYYDTDSATLGIIKVRLGRDTFADAPTLGSCEAFQVYAHTATFVRYYDYGSNAAGGQHLWLAFNPGGAGTFGGNRYATGAYVAFEGGAAGEGQIGECPDLSAITVNTITVSDYGPRDRMLKRGVHGPHPDTIRRG